jgi:hypothetical protein
MSDTRPHPASLVLVIIVAAMAGLAAGRWLTDTNAPPVSGYGAER